MENLRNNYSSIFWFNSHLFTVNGAPLKFYLDGYSQSEFRDMVRIIEAYGGKLSKLDAPDTFVFCELDRPIGAEESDRYDIQYFHDSIVALHPQELIHYKLRVITDHQSPTPVYEDELANSHGNEENNNFDKNDSIDEHSSTTESQTEVTDTGNSCTAARAQIYSRETKSFADVDHFNESKIAISGTNLQANGQNEDNYVEVQGKSCQNPSEDDEDSDDSGVSQTTDDSDLSQAESINDEFIPPSLRRSSIAAEKRGPGRVRFSFTEEENEIIIQWIIENELIPTDTGTIIWKKFIDEQVLPHLKCSKRILARNYKEKVKCHPIMKKYLENLNPARKSAVLTEKGAYWTDEENRTLMQYLIDSGALDKSKIKHIWKNCLESNKAIFNPKRTKEALRAHFKYSLRYHYAKFTDDPEILRKFKEIEPPTKIRKRR